MIKLILGDFLEKIQEVENNSIDLILTDPPYGVTQCKWDSIIPLEDFILTKNKNKDVIQTLQEFLQSCFINGLDFNASYNYFQENKQMGMWSHLKRVSKEKSTICLFGTDPFSSKLISSNFDAYKYDWFWKKNKSTNFLNAKKQPLRNVERISVFNSGNYFPIKSTGHKPVNSFTKNTSDGSTLGKTKIGFKGGGSTERYPNQTLEFPVVNNDHSSEVKIHPSQKPVDLLKYLIQTYTKEGDIVLDFTFGSGSTAIACIETNRKFIGIEKDPNYFQLAEKRINTFIKEKL